MIMETVKIGALTYKLGLHNKYYYLASSGEWLKASQQDRIKQEFGLIKNQTKEMSTAAKTRLMIMELIKSGEVMVSGMGRCSIIKRTVPVYKLV